jgi:hypothetical protein
MFSGIESLAEDGSPEMLSMRFMTQQGGTFGAETTLAGTTVGMPQFEPGESASVVLNVNQPGVNRYLSYAAMIVPSNDAFVANDNPLAYPLFDDAGNFLGPVTIDVFGSDVNDAGTEVNSETSAAFLPEPYGQTGPNQGDDQGGVIMAHPGFNGSIGNPDGMPVNILGGMTATGATIDTVLGDFTRDGGNVPVARITIVPEPSGGLLAAVALLPFAVARRKRRLSI